MPDQEEFRFIKTDRVGYPAAEDDSEFLNDCFIDTGDFDVLRDTRSPQCVIVGRTGSGKSALLQHLIEREQKVVQIAPEQLSLSYLANSTILPALENMGVDLDLFYRTLWRHIFVVELIKAKYDPREHEQQGAIERILAAVFPDDRKRKALEYLEEFGTAFWKDTEIRVQEISQHFEAEIKSQLGGELNLEFAKVGGELGEAERESATKRTEIVRRAQEIVGKTQLAKLGQVIDILAEVFAEPQPRYYIVIDQLDEGWIVERFRYRLIRALIETLRDFRKIPSAKIIIALRRDLLQHVIRMTRDTGFQEEKYESLYLPITWEREQLLSVLDARVRKLVRRRYTKAPVGWSDLLPERIGNKAVDKYFVERTQYRPRDIIAFFNECIGKAVGNPTISANVVRTAEAEYSRLRFRALNSRSQF